VKQFNPYDFYTYATAIHPLTELNASPTPLKDILWTLYSAKMQVRAILNGAVPLPVSTGAASALFWAIDAIVPDDFSKVDMERQITYELFQIKQAATSFETVFSAELQNANTYSVLQKGIYSTADLIQRAENALGEALTTISDDAKRDFSAAGRCLAFELPTASAFHTMRSTEAVLRQYHRLILKLPTTTKSPEMAQCVNELRAKGEEPKLMDILDHIRDLHRNTIMHPEAFLTMPEALRLFDIAKSAINAMAERVQAFPAATSLVGLAPNGTEAAVAEAGS